MDRNQVKQQIIERLKMANSPIPDDAALEKMVDAQMASQPKTPQPVTEAESPEKKLAKTRASYSPFDPNRPSEAEMKKSAGLSEAVPTPSYESPPPEEKSLEERVSEAKSTGSIAPVQALGEKILVKAKSSKPVSEEEYDETIQELKALSENGKYGMQSPETQKTLYDALAEAKKKYEERANVNEWAEVAQMLGRAVATWGAAKAGAFDDKHQSLDFGPGIDYNARTDRAAREYGEETRMLEKGYGTEYERRKDVLEEKLKAAREKKNLDQLGYRERKEQQRIDEATRREELRNTRDDLKTANEELKQTRIAASTIASLDDLSPKSVNKLESQLPGTLGKAGITQEDLDDIQTEATEKGMIWDSIDKGKRNKLIQERLVKKKEDEVRNLRQALDNLVKQREGRAPAQSPPPSGDVDMIAPDGRALRVPASKVAEMEAHGARRK